MAPRVDVFLISIYCVSSRMSIVLRTEIRIPLVHDGKSHIILAFLWIVNNSLSRFGMKSEVWNVMFY